MTGFVPDLRLSPELVHHVRGRRCSQVGGGRERSVSSRRARHHAPDHDGRSSYSETWCARQESNLLPLVPETNALSGELRAQRDSLL